MARRLQKKEKKLLALLLLLVAFNILSIPMYLVMYFNLSFKPLQYFLALATTKFLNALGYPVFQDGFTVVANNFNLIEISWDSTGWKSMYTLLALGIVTPVNSWKKRMKFICISIPAIFLLNFIRITTTILVGLNFGFQYFEVVHTFLWREGLILAIVCIWAAWLWNEKDNINISQYIIR
jgi:exosortase/archaeosortase family protein